GARPGAGCRRAWRAGGAVGSGPWGVSCAKSRSGQSKSATTWPVVRSQDACATFFGPYLLQTGPNPMELQLLPAQAPHANKIFVFDEVYPFRAAQEQAEKKKLGAFGMVAKF